MALHLLALTEHGSVKGMLHHPYRGVSQVTVGLAIDYRCDDGRFPMSANCMAIANAAPPSSSETGIDSCIKSLKSIYLIKLNIRKPLVVSIGIDF
jgi:hypothetical protein